ncbi:threonine--tRNA ligase [Pseudooceanicola sp. CBS1P-1]|uniref:Threonine--tRNA ligase n=1 Tax=Pseudooceanicola albus TaxID=2692189 RepID=A0A6L7GAX2_9RHOB|nr:MULTISPECIES: threonine--tRNA ligase [Pseudooceanicola]MBT9386621.1 threonine--tRNA ligase [Pseudooceanicola endophyticus]MXN20737.1 threonine--tRNA ligase [Pseudooceanicola albus]
MIHIRLPDGASRALSASSTAADLAASIGPSLAKRTVAAIVDGRLSDLSAPLPDGAAVELVARDDPRALDLIRHDLAHVLAEAVQALWPGTRTAIGPAIEHGFYYDFDRETPFTPEDLPVIEKKMREIIAARTPFTCEEWGREEARAHFEAAGEPYKIALLDAIPKGEPVTIYRQGDWLDLCRGPHMRTTGDAGTAFRLTRVAGAYWRGDANNKMLSRIYGVAFADKVALEAHMTMMAEAEKRDHRRLGREMNLFHFEEVAPGSVFWHPNGWRLFQTLIGYMRARQEEAGYVEVNSPDIMDRSLWETSGHWQNYRENMFLAKTQDDRDYALKPMNCPGHMLIYGQGTKSYRDLPLKLAEFGKVHRYEPSGALHGLLRVRSFTQDDAHIYCTPGQLTEECLKVNDLVMSIYRDFGFGDVRIKLSTRPENRIGSEESWDRSEGALREALDQAGHPYTIFEGEGAFYGPKLEYVLRDAIGRDWQCGTLQVDFNLPERFGSTYVAPSGEKLAPVMLHRALFGSLERFTGILIEHHAGHLPLWLAPIQVVVATVTEAADGWATEVAKVLRASGLRVETDLRNEKIGYKVREHALRKVPVQIALGAREAEQGTVTIRRHGTEGTRTLDLGEAVDCLARQARPPRELG